MDPDAKMLYILFRRIPSDQFLKQQLTLSSVRMDETKLPLYFADTELGEYTQDEQKMIFHRTKEGVAEFLRQEELEWHTNAPCTLPWTAFFSLIRFSKRILTLNGEEPQCSIRDVGLWRQTYLMLGQDLLVCAYLAFRDFQRRRTRQNFVWPAVIDTDHRALNEQLALGLAENHFHLYGSTQIFPLAWCNLMNYPLDIETADWSQFTHFLQPFTIYTPEDCLFSTKERVRYAAFFRSQLFCCFHPELKKKPVHLFHPEIYARSRIGTLRHQYGAKVPQPNGQANQLDYALEKSVPHAVLDSPYRCLAGERNVLYQCFLALLHGELTQHEQNLFYTYILLKLQFRSEIIQVNRQSGFQNFQNYQRRKGTLICRDFYWTEAIRMGLNAPLQIGNVTSLEARVTPKMQADEYLEMVRDIDSKKAFSDESAFRLPSPFPSAPKSDCGVQEAVSMPYFFVIHFIKQADRPSRSPLALECRHQSLRQSTRQQAIAMAKSLSNSPWLCGRIRGIDCSSNEIGCPPEVFASVFRFLRNFQPQEYFRAALFQEMGVPRLSATYHVGEDFLELASGLRAIDESVLYLELQRDDRLGHALGLGVAPADYYAGKGYRLYTTKQERLDDLVWLLYRTQEMGVAIDPDLRSQLAKEAEILFLEIYGSSDATLLQYYCSMQLRGDDPSLYISGEYRGPSILSDHYDFFQYSRRTPDLAVYRKTKAIVSFYYRYHYGFYEKQRGAKIQEVDITPQYIQLMSQVQDRLQAYLGKQNIIIECNPSSNILIGSFRTYREHPVFRFFNGGVCGTGEMPQLHICVNTDDLGVFDTSLAFEYALLFYALDREMNSDGFPKYQTNDELRYLKHIQNMSRMAVFRDCMDGQNRR